MAKKGKSKSEEVSSALPVEGSDAMAIDEEGRQSPGADAGSNESRKAKAKRKANLAQDELPWSPVLTSKAGSVPLVFTRDEEFFFVAASSSIRVYSSATGRLVSTLSSSSHASTSYGADVGNAERTAERASHSAAITGLLLNPSNPAQLLSSSLDGTVKVWDFMDGALLRTFSLGSAVTLMACHASLKDRIVIAVRRAHLDEHDAALATNDAPSTSTIILTLLLTSKKGKGSDIVTRPSTERVGKARDLVDIAISSDGRFVVGVGKRKIHVAHLRGKGSKDAMLKILTDKPITRLAFHPTNNTFATGHENGQIRVWYFLEGDAVQLPTSNAAQLAPNTLLHWHAHAVSALRFSDNGSLLLSGGEESVLVLWQLTAQSREYVPRLGGAKIVSIGSLQGSSANGKEEYVVALEDGGVTFISPINLRPLRSFGGVLASSTAHAAATTGSVQGPTRSRCTVQPPLVVQPETNHLVVQAGHPSTLQFLNPNTGEQVLLQEIVASNRVSRPDDDPLDQAQVEHVCFTTQRDWMATTDRMPSGETRLKIWSWDAKTEAYVVSTRIDHPHGGADVRVRGMAFSPRTFASLASPLLVTYGSDSKCRAWRVVTQEIKRKKETYWVARSVFDHRDRMPSAVAWSEDGSLLAVVHGASVALWEPEDNALLHVFPLPTAEADGCGSHLTFAGQGGRFLVVAVNGVLSVFDIVLGTLVYDMPIVGQVAGVVPLQSRRDGVDFALAATAPSSALTGTVSLLATTSALAKLVNTVPFGIRKVVSASTKPDSQLSLFALTHDFDIVRIGASETATEESAEEHIAHPLAHTRSVQRRRTLFDELLGRQEDAEQGAAAAVAVPDLPTPTTRRDDMSKLFDMPSHLLPPPHLLIGPFMRMVLPPRPKEFTTNTAQAA